MMLRPKQLPVPEDLMTSRHSFSLRLPVIVACLAASTFFFTAAPAAALTLDEIVEMVAVDVPDDIIVSTIEGSEEVFKLSAQDIVDLKGKGVSDTVIKALQGTSGGAGRSGSEDGSRDRDDDDTRDRDDRDDRSRDRDRDDDRSRDRSDSRDRDRSDSRDRDRDRSDSRDRSRDRDSGDEEEEEGLIRRRRSRGDGDSGSGKSRKSSKRVKKSPKALKKAIALVKNKKVLTGSRDLFEFIESGKYPEQDAKAYYWLGKALKDMGLIHSAQYYYQKVVKEGAEAGPYFAKSLAEMVHISERTKDPIYLVKKISTISPDDYPGTVKDDLYYYSGIDAFDKKEYTAAKRAFSRLGKSNPHYIQARYYLGVIHNLQKKKTKAFGVFKSIYLGDFRADPAIVSDIKRLSLLNMARLYYASENFNKAINLYERVPRLSPQYPAAMHEAAWAYFMSQGKENEALGHTLTLTSPFFEDDWLPEVPLIEALTYYTICEYKEVESRLDGFKSKYLPVQEQIEKLLPEDTQDLSAAGKLYKKLYTKGDPTHRRLPASVYSAVDANNQFAGPHNRVLQIQKELARARSQKAGWAGKAIGKAVVKNLKKEHRIYMKLAGIQLTNELARIRDQIADLMGQEALLRFEMVSGEYKKAERNFRNPDLANVDESTEFDFATNYKKIYWPFNDEFWEDELGYIVRAETGDCKE
jgi:tetratricopeptide (TPR) repeat protein